MEERERQRERRERGEREREKEREKKREREEREREERERENPKLLLGGRTISNFWFLLVRGQHLLAQKDFPSTVELCQTCLPSMLVLSVSICWTTPPTHTQFNMSGCYCTSTMLCVRKRGGENWHIQNPTKRWTLDKFSPELQNGRSVPILLNNCRLSARLDAKTDVKSRTTKDNVNSNNW